MIKTYAELKSIETFEDRFNYLKIGGQVGFETFGFDRVFNQKFYASSEWKRVRNLVILRDNGCDLGVKGCEINGTIYIHHINPITIEDIKESTEFLLNPENLICVSYDTHQAIHYGSFAQANRYTVTERAPGDTKLW